MSKRTILKRCLLPLLDAALGYKRLRHFGRWLCINAGADAASDDWEINGERYFVECALKEAKQRVHDIQHRKLIILEVGANHGQQTRMMVDIAKSEGIDAFTAIHSFEPSNVAYQGLKLALDATDSQCELTPNRAAVGSRKGEAILCCFDAVGGGTNCLNEGRRKELLRANLESTEECIEVIRLDDYLHRTGVDHVTVLKTDTEGHEMEVLIGIVPFLQRGAVDYIQFEYNSTWIHERRFLLEAFELLLPLGYKIGKLRPDAVEYFPSWDYRLEWFEQCNYVAWREPLRPLFHIHTTSSYLS